MFTFETDLQLRSASKDAITNGKEKNVPCLSLNFHGRYWIATASRVHKQTEVTSKAILHYDLLSPDYTPQK